MPNSRNGGIKSYAVGHFALGYLTAKLTAHFTKTRVNVPIILALSVAPDVDLLIPFVEHRGPFHSILMAIIIFIPIIILARKDAIPYFIALIHHSLLGDFITGKTQLFWPITTQSFGTAVAIESLANITVEWLAFLIMFIEILRAKDLQTLLKPNHTNIILAVPTLLTVLLPTFLAFPLKVPTSLIIPHLIMLTLFSASILTDVRKTILKPLNRLG
ncbi:MAG: metal-dependent hydrolase [Candidatus Bathyarchaeia archaeon]